MKAIFNQHKNPLNINGTPVEVKQIIDTQCVVILPTGKKAFLPVSDLKSFSGEINFESSEIIPDAEVAVTAEKQPAPLFETENDQAS